MSKSDDGALVAQIVKGVVGLLGAVVVAVKCSITKKDKIVWFIILIAIIILICFLLFLIFLKYFIVL